MKIIIAGAGEVGFHLSKLLASENQDITLIDMDQEVLEHVYTHLDVMTIKGDAASMENLLQAQTPKAHLFLAVTTSEKTNLLAAILAKKLGAKTTIARVNSPEYLREPQKSYFHELGVDKLISPQYLAAQEIERLLKRSTFTDVFEFEDGKISVVGFKIDRASPLIGHVLENGEIKSEGCQFRTIAILRGNKTIIPTASNRLRRGDHIYLVTRNKDLDKVTGFVGKQLKKLKRIMIIGGTPLAAFTAQMLENHYSVTLIEKGKEAGKSLLDVLHNTLVVNGDPSNIDVLKEEGLENMDVFIALSPNSETNIITSLMAEECGVYKTIALVTNPDYTHISQNIGVDTIINRKLIAANNIFRYVRKGHVEAIASLHGVDAEVIEFVIHKKNRILRHRLKELHMPEKAIIIGVVRGNESFIPDADFQLQLEDKVIVFAQPEAIGKVEALLK